MREVRFGVIGCGLMGREFASAAARWLHLLDPSARPVITAVCDTSFQAVQWFQEHVPSVSFTTSDHRELLQQDIEAVYVAVPHHLHEQVYIDVLNSGKHLMAEKPFGIDLASATRIMDAVRSHPNLLVRCSSEFPFYPGAQRIVQMAASHQFGDVIEVRAGFLHSSDLDPNKKINWKRRIETNGEYGCMGDLGLHVCHLPLRFGWPPKNVRALLSNVIRTRPDESGDSVPCETWDNAVLACESALCFPMILETKRISPGDMNTWYIEILGTQTSARFSTKHPKTLWTLPFSSGGRQGWIAEDVGYEPVFPSITGHIFEFGFPDAILQMWASYLQELVGGDVPFRCATPEESLMSHRLFTAALESQRSSATVEVPIHG